MTATSLEGSLDMRALFVRFIFGSLLKKSPCEHDPYLDALLSNIAQAKIQHFTAEFARTARKIATETRIQGCNPALRDAPETGPPGLPNAR
jgi:hypothetical protein